MEHEDRNEPGDRVDVVIVGGGAAGLGAALQLGRARRTVVVIDAGEPRNAPAAHMHSYLGHEGRPPGEFLDIARDEVRRYGVEIVRGAATEVTRGPHGNGFDVALADGRVIPGRRVLVATGLVDELPEIPGVREQWGRGVLHCPYCHGWEVRDQKIVVIATNEMGVHQALLFRQLSDDVTVITQGPGVLAAEDRIRLDGRGILIESGPVAEIVIEADQVTGVRLDDAKVLDAQAVVVAPRFVARSRPLHSLGITPVPDPTGKGEMIQTDARGATTVEGVYAAGNVADVSHQVLQAAADGSRIGAMINADLVDEDTSAALAVSSGDSAEDWDRRYAGTARWWSGHPNASLVDETAELEPGTALDVGCGEGADAIWLAQRGWKVTGTDISQVALDRAARASAEAGVQIEWVRADPTTDPPTPGGYDLVSVHYPALRHSADDDPIGAIIGAVAPRGTLLVVGHSLEDGDHARRHGIDPTDYVQPGDVAAALDPGWTVEVHETRPRTPPPGHDGPDVPDVVLRARRS